MQTLIEIFNGFFEGRYNLTCFKSKPASREVKNLQILLGYLVCGYFLPTLCRILFFKKPPGLNLRPIFCFFYRFSSFKRSGLLRSPVRGND
jgi:hypothetical protein